MAMGVHQTKLIIRGDPKIKKKGLRNPALNDVDND